MARHLIKAEACLAGNFNHNFWEEHNTFSDRNLLNLNKVRCLQR